MIQEKTLTTLEYPKILEQLARYTTFSAGAELARELYPTTDLSEAQTRIQEVTEVRTILGKNENKLNMGGVRDVRQVALGATRGVVIEAAVLLDIRNTLRRATTIKRTIGRMEHVYPLASALVQEMEECPSVQDEIVTAIDDDAQVRDSASPRLAMIRRDLKTAFERLQAKLNRMIQGGQYAQYLQEPIITMRNGRYVVPVKADFKGRLKGILHDTSSSGQTIFIEPEATVELNNEWRDLQIQEEKEVWRILAALTESVAQVADEIIRTVEVLAYLDLLIAKSMYADALRATAPTLVGFRERAAYPNHPGSTITLTQARHPLIPSQRVVPTDVDFGQDTFALVLTGPNTGGKTVALKTVGLLALMAQSGLHVPAESATLSVFEGIFADIGDEQSIEQSLSTFSAHMTNTIGILEACNPTTLVLLDEMGAGTDPSEGSALARAIMNHLLQRRTTAMVTTHHPELKTYAVETDGVRNASVEFNLETLAPTYRLIVGLPGRSNALAIATRLGLPSTIIEDARAMVASKDLDADKLLDEIHRTREDIHRKETRIADLLEQIEAERLELRERLSKLEDERRNILIDARRKAEGEIEDFRKEVKRLRQDLRKASLPLEQLQAIQDASTKLIEYAQAPLNENDAVQVPDVAEDGWRPRLGDAVWLESLKVEGVIEELNAKGEAMVQVGALKVRATTHDMRKATKLDRKIAQKEASRRRERPETEREDSITPPKSPGLELDLRGQRVEGALRSLDEYIDAAYLSGLPFARIIHGKGTGALRKAIRDMLDSHALIIKVAEANPNEGGAGVTIIYMSTESR